MVFVNSLKTKNEAARMNLSLPREWLFSNYLVVIREGNLIQGFSNSFLYAFLSATIAVVTCAMAAFVLNREKSKLNRMIYYFILCGFFFPVNFVTLMKIFNTIGIANTRFGLIIAFTSGMVPFCIFTISNFISSVPVEIDEAAVIDGANALMLFFKIVLPLLKPVLITTFLLQFMGVWNDFMTPLYLSSTSKMWPMNLAVYNFFGKMSSNWQYVFADIILTCLPVAVIYFFGQKYIISGLSSGAVKK
jgi:raffinose/stachyose/melibiose transport system permease protein